MHNLTPIWNEIHQDSPAAHNALAYIADIIYVAKSTSVPLPDSSDMDLAPAVDLGALIVKDGEVSFKDSNILKDYIVRHATDAVVLPTWEDPEAFARAFADIMHRSTKLKMREDVTSRVLLVMTQEHRKNLLNQVAKLANFKADERKWLFWSIYPSFCEVLPQLDLDPNDLARDLGPIIEASKNDLTGGSLYRAVENLARRSHDTAESLFEAFIACSDSPVVALASNALVALATFNLQTAHNKSITLLDSEKLVIRQVGIRSLGYFDYSTDSDGAILKSTLEKLEELKNKPDTDTDHVLVLAYGELLKYEEEEASRALIEMAKRSDSAVYFQLSNILFHIVEEKYKKSWFKQVFFHLTPVPSSHIRTLQNLDFCATRYVRELPKLALSFMKKLITSREYTGEEKDDVIPEMLQSTFSSLLKNQPERLEEEVTKWFASEDPRLHRAARDIVQHHVFISPRSKQSLLSLSKAVLNKLDEQIIVHLLQRIMGYVIYSRPLAVLLASALRRDPCPDSISNFITYALSEYLLYNYPGEAGEYLRKRLKDPGIDNNSIENRAIQNALAQTDEYLEARRQLPESKELQPSLNHLYLLRVAQNKHYAAIMEQANDRSPLLSLAHRVPLKYGRTYFTEIDGQLTSPTPLSSISTQWEPPRGEFIDPIGQAFLRLKWQQAGLNKTKDGKLQNEDEAFEI